MDSILLVSSVLLWILVLFILLLTLTLARKINRLPTVSSDEGPTKEDFVFLAKGTEAPQFEARSTTGQTVTLDNYKQNKVAFVFISPSCGPCIEKLPTLQVIGEKARKHTGVELVLVSLGSESEIESFVKRYSIKLPVLITPRDSSFAENYLIKGTPLYYVIDEQSRVELAGFLDGEWERAVHQWTGMDIAQLNKSV